MLLMEENLKKIRPQKKSGARKECNIAIADVLRKTCTRYLLPKQIYLQIVCRNRDSYSEVSSNS